MEAKKKKNCFYTNKFVSVTRIDWQGSEKVKNGSHNIQLIMYTTIVSVELN